MLITQNGKHMIYLKFMRAPNIQFPEPNFKFSTPNNIKSLKIPKSFF